LLDSRVVTTTFPVVAPAGITATIDVALQLEIDVADTPLNLTTLDPCVAPKLLPEIVTALPTAAEAGVICVIIGAATIAKLRGTGVAAFQDAFPACDAVIVQFPACSGVTVLPETEQFPDAANETGRPDDAVALT